jgi:hypothetical protein
MASHLRKALCAHVALFIRVPGKGLSANYFASLDVSHLAAGQRASVNGSLKVLLRLFRVGARRQPLKSLPTS